MVRIRADVRFKRATLPEEVIAITLYQPPCKSGLVSAMMPLTGTPALMFTLFGINTNTSRPPRNTTPAITSRAADGSFEKPLDPYLNIRTYIAPQISE